MNQNEQLSLLNVAKSDIKTILIAIFGLSHIIYIIPKVIRLCSYIFKIVLKALNWIYIEMRLYGHTKESRSLLRKEIEHEIKLKKLKTHELDKDQKLYQILKNSKKG